MCGACRRIAQQSENKTYSPKNTFCTVMSYKGMYKTKDKRRGAKDRGRDKREEHSTAVWHRHGLVI